MTPEAVFFDLDATLVSYDEELADARNVVAWQEVAVAAGVDAATLFARHRSAIAEIWRAAESRLIERRERIDGMLLLLETYRQALLACGCDDESLAQRVFDRYWGSRHDIFRPFKDVTAVLDALQGRVRLAVITNGPAITQIDKLQVTGLDHYFDLFVASGDIGYAKPDASIFRFALDKLGVAAGRTWHVGDNPMSDVLGAHNAGLTSIWLNRHGADREASHPEPHHEIADLSDLVGLLGLAE